MHFDLFEAEEEENMPEDEDPCQLGFAMFFNRWMPHPVLYTLEEDGLKAYFPFSLVFTALSVAIYSRFWGVGRYNYCA